MLSASASMRWAVTSVRGVDLRINAGDIVQRLAGDLPGAQFAIVQRTLDLGDGEMVKCHALYTPAMSSRGPRG